jgi:hypothetical protein
MLTSWNTNFPWLSLTANCTSLTFFFNLVYEALGTAATPGLLCQPRVIVKMIVEKHMECRFARKTEILGENLPQRHFCPSQNPTWPDPGFEPGPPRWEAGDSPPELWRGLLHSLASEFTSIRNTLHRLHKETPSILSCDVILEKTQVPPLLRVGQCLQSYCLATLCSNSLQYHKLPMRGSESSIYNWSRFESSTSSIRREIMERIEYCVQKLLLYRMFDKKQVLLVFTRNMVPFLFKASANCHDLGVVRDL